jgi:hypothetical protein
MLVGFEKITEDLTPFEEREALPIILAGLRTKLGKEKAISGTEICSKVNATGRLGKYKLTPVKLRKMISHIRLYDLISGVLSSSKGYYLALTLSEYDDCIESLRQRIRQQQLVVDSLQSQRDHERREL